MSDLLVRADGKRGRWKVSNNKSVYCLFLLFLEYLFIYFFYSV